MMKATVQTCSQSDGASHISKSYWRALPILSKGKLLAAVFITFVGDMIVTATEQFDRLEVRIV